MRRIRNLLGRESDKKTGQAVAAEDGDDAVADPLDASRGGAADPFSRTGAAARGLSSFDWLRNNPQFQQLRQVIQQQPQILEPVLHSVSAGNPQLAQLIGQHPDQFLELLGEGGDYNAPLPPGAQVLIIPEEETEAIERVSPKILYSTQRNSLVTLCHSYVS